VVAIGEVGLGGEVRRVGRVDARVQEAARLGFARVLVPRGSQEKLLAKPAGRPAAAPPAGSSGTRGAEPLPVGDVAEAVLWLREAAG
jgi:hypothetical protein